MGKMQRTKHLFLAGALTALTGEIYFYPFGTGFRFTAGVITISFAVLYLDTVSELVLVPFCGLNVVLFRAFLSVVFNGTAPAKALLIHFPSLFFYLSYAVFLKLANIRKRTKEPMSFITVMAVVDLLSNFVELFVRGELSMISSQERYTLALTVGFIRGMLTFFLYWLFERSRILIAKEEHQKRYAELLALLAELKAELFYIRKSTGNLEWAMKECYEIYQVLDQALGEDDMGKLKKKALNLAKDIHEIKKDYMRMAAGVAELLPEENRDGMRFSEIMDIIESNTQRWIKAGDMNIEFFASVEEDMMVKNYFSVTSIINNLISNALDASSGHGEIRANIGLKGREVLITLHDDGKGISPKDLPFIFEPGFSTKFALDGSIYTGLGLTHAKNLVEDMGGTIRVSSAPEKGTTFSIALPAEGGFSPILP